ncbi:DUF4139 domain-containing protein [Kitasatospora acidiphila]|uniref:DUF4139 domain-containing protein n=1 Tax=Kitasatospora acidiphila TaxID=2567942 RepID=UPI001E2D285A|nr:DUF4139 domain-containing protein [Kitasatospora acidiphila]
MLDAVVVHASGALCTRVAGVALPAEGPVRLRLTGLPAVLEPGTVRARLAAAPAGWRITELRPSLEAAPSTAAEPTELAELVTAAAERVAALRLRAELLDTRITRTAELRAVPPEPARDRPAELRRAPVAALRALADFVDGRLAALHQSAEEVREQLERAEREHARLVDELERASRDRPDRTVAAGTAVLVTLAPDDPALPRPTMGVPPAEGWGTVTVELEYRVPGACWVPSYQLSHRQGEAVGTLTLRAAVAQRTGEDWTGVRLALSTADLLRPAELPKLRSLRIGRRQPAPAPSGWREPPSGLNALFADYDQAPAPPGPAPVAVAAAAAGPIRHAAHIEPDDFLIGGAAAPAPSQIAYGAAAPAPAPQGYGAPPPPTGPPAPQAPGAAGPQHRMRAMVAMAAPAPAAARWPHLPRHRRRPRRPSRPPSCSTTRP